MEKYYISTAIAYVNGAPHIGHALEFIQADSMARFMRMMGKDVYFLTGTDEHGQKIYEKSQELKLDTQSFVDENAAKFVELDEKMKISYDGFVRTTSQEHKKAVVDMWNRLYENGDIYKDSYEGNYCVGCEAYLLDKELDENGFCPVHKKAPKRLKEENYFFKLSKYSDEIVEAIESDRMRIVPESRKNEILSFMKEGLKDVSFSRPKSQLPWGITVPNDEEHVMYVWPDALSNYLSGVGFGGKKLDGLEWKDFDGDLAELWPCDVHVIGKDILRFHAAIWPGILISAGFELPKVLMVHGFLTLNGAKMGKSTGNVIDPFELVDRYGLDAFRYFLMRETPTLADGDFSEERFKIVYDSELRNGVGNLLNRVVMMVERYLDGEVGEKVDGGDFEEKLSKLLEQYKADFESFDLKKACETLMETVDFANKYIDDMKPWVMSKDEALIGDLKAVMYRLIEALKVISIMFKPFTPDTAEKILVQIGMGSQSFDLDYKWGEIPAQTKVEKGDVLFEMIEK